MSTTSTIELNKKAFDISGDPQTDEGLSQVAKALLAGGLTGAGVRSLLGMYQATIDRPSFHPKITPPMTVRVPTVVDQEEDDLNKGKALKYANDGSVASSLAHALQYVPNTISDAWQKYAPEFTSPTGTKETPPESLPWVMAGKMLGGGAAGALGYMGARPIVKNILQSQDEAEKNRAREEYYAELANAVSNNRKQASEEGSGFAALESAFDEFYDKLTDQVGDDFQKSASLGLSVLSRLLWPLSNFGDVGAAATLGLSGLAGGVGAFHAYNKFRDQSLPALLNAQADKVKAEDEHEPEIQLALDKKNVLPITNNKI